MFSQLSVNGPTGIYKDRILRFISTFADAVFLDSNTSETTSIPFTGIKYSYLAAAGISDVIHADHHNLSHLQHFLETSRKKGEWVFGFLSYDLKNDLENLDSVNPDHTGFPLFHFFTARHVFIATDSELTVVDKDDPASLWDQINSTVVEDRPSENAEIHISHILNRDNYLNAVKQLQHHIQKGDIYEINFCHEILADTVNLDPPAVFRKLNRISPNPFACYYITRGLHLVCASPERFLAKKGATLISQPIKGTMGRGANKEKDEINRKLLETSEKEHSENIMIVDLVRNDLSKVAQRGTVRVEELCGIYTYPKVHQMISTVACELNTGTSFLDIIAATFPMGSMTGAPKISAMKLIDKYENFKRTLFSGAVGYIDPEGDFDFNVVIRSILFQEGTAVASISAGSAITAASDPEQEYNETLVKLSPQLEALGVSMEVLLKEFSNDHIV